MTTRQLCEPIIENGILSTNFFNGRLLAAEDLQAEQQAQRQQRALLGEAIGAGVVQGLTVEMADVQPNAINATLLVKAGSAINANGDALELPNDETLRIVPERTGALISGGQFGDCTIDISTLPTSVGIYVLLLTPASGFKGNAPMSGLGQNGQITGCGRRYRVDGVQFKLVKLDLSAVDASEALSSLFTATNLPPNATLPANDTANLSQLRNRVAHLCFGTTTIAGFPRSPAPLAQLLAGYGLLDTLQAKTHAAFTHDDVPLAVIYWSVRGLRFVDTWSVRRQRIEPDAYRQLAPLIGDRRAAEAEAIWLQFQEQLAWLLSVQPQGNVGRAVDYFAYLPPAGYLSEGVTGVNWQTFLGEHAPPVATAVDTGLLRAILLRALALEPFRLHQPPLATVTVYRSPTQDNLVLYARSLGGRLRIQLNPAPTAEQTVRMTVQPVGSNVQLEMTPGGDGRFVLGELAAGAYTVQAEVTEYEPASLSNVAVIGGLTTDRVMPLTLLPNGSLLLLITDLASAAIGGQVSSIRATGAISGQASAPKYIAAANQWVFAGLPPDDYTITIVAAGFQTGTLTGVHVPRGRPTLRTIALTPKPPQIQEPPHCVKTDLSEWANFNLRIRLCLLFKATEFTEDFFVQAALQVAKVGQREPGINLGLLEQAGAKTDAYVPARYYINRAGRQRGPLLSSKPWLKMQRVTPLPQAVAEWLAEWQAYFDQEFPGQRIAQATPAIFIAQNYTPPQQPSDVPDEAYAYAVFGNFAVPMTITAEERLTKRRVPITKKVIPGITDDLLADLAELNIYYIDELPDLWGDLLVDVIDEPINYLHLLVDDARISVGDINAARIYYDGVDEQVATTLAELGYSDDVALANADLNQLGEALGSQGFALRLITQAREIVAPEFWALDALNLSQGQIATLSENEVDSLGALFHKTASTEGKNELAAMLNIPAAQLDQFITNWQSKAIQQMTIGSLALAGNKNLLMVPGITAAVANSLATAGVKSVNELASADAAALATTTGLTQAEAETLVANARTAGAGNLDVLLLAPLSGETAGALRGQGVTTVSALAGKTAAEIAGAFNNNPTIADALIKAVKIGLG